MVAAVRSGDGQRRAGRARSRSGNRPETAEAGAPLPDILESLTEEHNYLLRLARLLEKQVARLNLKQQPDYEVMRGVMRYMTNYPDRFHHPKEDLLFRKVVRRDPSLKPVVDELLEHHERIIGQGAELVALIERCRAEPEKADTFALRKGAHAYIGRLRRHMDIEMLRVFPRAQEVLRPEDWVDVDARMKPILDPVFGENVAPEFQTLRAQEERGPDTRAQRRARRGLNEAAATIEAASALIVGATKASTSLSRHNRKAVSANARVIRDLLSGRPLGERVKLFGSACVRNIEMARDINRRLTDVWTEALKAAGRPYREDQTYAAKVVKACKRLKLSALRPSGAQAPSAR